jgi:hypothetical protein
MAEKKFRSEGFEVAVEHVLTEVRVLGHEANVRRVGLRKKGALPRGSGRAAALGYTGITAGVAVFQLALALGAPWGSYAMGGAFPGQYPTFMRIEALFGAALLAVMAGVVLSRAGLALPRLSRASRWLVWIIVAYGVVGLVLNLISPSGGERAIWTPVALVLLACSFVVATGTRTSKG